MMMAAVSDSILTSVLSKWYSDHYPRC